MQVTIEVVLAAQMYRRDHGDFPETLSALVPDYLGAVPLDPCDPTGGRLRYGQDALERYVVWSVCHAGTDDGGEVSVKTGRPRDLGFILR